jgi:hypothetical protein
MKLGPLTVVIVPSRKPLITALVPAPYSGNFGHKDARFIFNRADNILTETNAEAVYKSDKFFIFYFHD